MGLYDAFAKQFGSGGGGESDSNEYVDAFFAEMDQNPRAKWRMAEKKDEMETFVAEQHLQKRRVVIVTSGATVTPLDEHATNYIDGVESGTNGAACAEHFLRLGYAVILLHREGSELPFSRHFAQFIQNGAFMGLLKIDHNFGSQSPSSGPALKVDVQGNINVYADLISTYEQSRGRILQIAFKEIQQYLLYLRLAASALSIAGNRGMIVLAASVMDYYIPSKDFVVGQPNNSRKDYAIKFIRVPNILRKIRKVWCPKAFMVTFKVEKDNVLEAAHNDLEKWGVNVVVGSCPDSRDKQLIIVTELEDGLVTQSSSSPNQEIEVPFSHTMARMHKHFYQQRFILQRCKQLLLLGAKFSMMKVNDVVSEDASGNRNVQFREGIRLRADKKLGEKSPVYELVHIFQNKSHCARAHIWESVKNDCNSESPEILVVFSPAGTPNTIRDVWGDFWSGWAEDEIAEFKEQMSQASLHDALDVVTGTIAGDYSSASAIASYVWNKVGSMWSEGEQTRIRQTLQNMLSMLLNRGLEEMKCLNPLEEVLKFQKLVRHESLIGEIEDGYCRSRKASFSEDDVSLLKEQAKSVRVHKAAASYFYDMVDDGLIKTLLPYLEKDVNIHITGYSMGGMLGQLCLLTLGEEARMLGADLSKINFVGFGSPRVGDIGFAARLKLLYSPSQVLSVLHSFDTVHAFPPLSEGYADSCLKIFLKEDGENIGRRPANWKFSVVPTTRSVDKWLERIYTSRSNSKDIIVQCEFCESKSHSTEAHRCHICTQRGNHRGVDCPNKDSGCSLCGKKTHYTAEHKCKVCSQVGHRGRECHTQHDIGVTEMMACFRYHSFMYYNSNFKTSIDFSSMN